MLPQAVAGSFSESYRARFRVPPLLYSPYTYDATLAVIAAMQRANSTAPSALLAELPRTALDGTTGRVQFDRFGDRRHANVTIFRFDKGTVHPVAVMTGDSSEPAEPFTKRLTLPRR